MKYKRKFAQLALGAAAATLAMTVARADIVLVGATPATSFTDLGAQGFGNAPRMLTLQTNDFESGGVTPIDTVNGDAVSGSNKSTTPTLSDLNWNSGANVGIGFNADQSHTGITLDTLVLTIYDGTTPVGSPFSLTSPITFSLADLTLQNGNGNSVFNFHLTLAQQGAFDTILGMSGSSGFYAGLSASLGCTDNSPAGCISSNDGPDSFVGFAESEVPLPAALPLFATGLVGLGLLGWRRKRKVLAA
jgi:hypothetical protein